MEIKNKNILLYTSLFSFFALLLIANFFLKSNEEEVLILDSKKMSKIVFLEDSLLFNLNKSNDNVLEEISIIKNKNVGRKVLDIINRIEIQQLELKEKIKKLAGDNFFVLPDSPLVNVPPTMTLDTVEIHDLDGLKQKLIFQKTSLYLLPKVSKSKVMQAFSEKEINFLINILDSLNNPNLY